MCAWGHQYIRCPTYPVSVQVSTNNIVLQETARMFGGIHNSPHEWGCITMFQYVHWPAQRSLWAGVVWYSVPVHLLVYLFHTVEKAVWQHMPACSLACLVVFVRGLFYTSHCLWGCITNTVTGLPMPNSLNEGDCFTLCASNFAVLLCWHVLQST